jgi:glycosyltransferase involved in cell wall biosynthesis
MRIFQVSLFHFPVNGGQQYLVDKIHCLLKTEGYQSYIIQPLTLRLLLSSYRTDFPNHLIGLPNIYTLIYQIFQLLPRALRPRLFASYEEALWRGFNFSLSLIPGFIFKHDDLIIVHYHFHYEPLMHINSRKYVFSHGVEWSRPPLTRLDIDKEKSLFRLLGLPIQCRPAKIIANDKDYINEIKAVAKQVTRMLPASLYDFDSKIEYLPNACDTNFFTPKQPSPFSTANSDVIISCVRNIRPDRGILEAIEVHALLKEKGFRSILNIAGLYEPASPYYQRCRRLADLVGSVRFLGSISRFQVRDLYHQSHVTLVPSQEKEGTSLSALESMAVGTPCVSTSIGGLADIPTFKARSNSPCALANAVIFVLENYERISLEQMSETRGKYGTETWSDRVIHLIQP